MPSTKPSSDPARSAEIDKVLASLPEAARTALEALRGTIAAAAPEAVESINYGVPAFKYRGRPLVSFAAAKNHCSFYVQSPAVMEAHPRRAGVLRHLEGHAPLRSRRTAARRAHHEAGHGAHGRNGRDREDVGRDVDQRGATIVRWRSTAIQPRD